MLHITEWMRLEVTCGSHLVQFLLKQSRVPRPTSGRLFKISKEDIPQPPWTISSSGPSPSQHRSASQCLECPVIQFLPTASWPSAGHHSEEPGSLFFAPSPHIFVNTDGIPHALNLLISRLYNPSSQNLPSWEALLSLHRLYGPPLDSVQEIHVSSVLRSPNLDTAFQVRPHQCWVKGKHHLPQPDEDTPPDAAQTLIFSTTKTHCWHGSTWWPPGPSNSFLQRCFSASLVLVWHSGLFFQRAGLRISLHWTYYASYQPISPAWPRPFPWQHNTLVYQPPAGSMLYPIIQMVNEHAQQDWSPARTWGTALVTGL